MTDKKVLLAISAKSSGAGITRFLSNFIIGSNVSVRLCVLDEEQGEEMVREDLLDDLSALCFAKSIPMRIDRLNYTDQARLFSFASFSDLMIIEKSVLQFLAIGLDFPANSCASIAIPENFDRITNILLITDGSARSIQGVKQFFQIFPHLRGNPDVNLISIEGGEHSLEADDELLLLEYLKQYSKNVGILKVEEPITTKLLRPIKYDNHTIVVSNINYLISKYGDDGIFKPFFDDTSTLFFPSMIA
jgi:hypothetical protein